MKKIAFGVAAMMAALAGSASAAQITFVHESFGSGSIGNATFGDAAPVAFTITATGDTDNRQSFGDGYWIDHASASITIAGVGTFDFVSSTRTFVYNTGEIVGFSRAGATGNDLVNGPKLFPELGVWDMTSSIGPLTGAGEVLQWSSPLVETTGGILFFNTNPDATVTFTASVVPMPGTVAMGSVALLAAARRRR